MLASTRWQASSSAGGTTSFEFRADRPGTFRFYSNLTSDRAHADMQGQLIVRPQ